ncbi:MAG TPA: response regulator [Anaerolineales bacterium]|nr:response regulator [Anaerolineales bacterium]
MNQPKFPLKDSPIRILVVDDHLGTATTLARAISQLGPGLEVIPATSGEEALQRVKHAAADILITDMIMPGMTGLQLLEKLQSHPAGRPTFSFLITAYDVPGLRLSARHLNVTEVFTKPVNPERICQTIVQTVEKIYQARPAPTTPALEKKHTVLIADDQPDNLLLLARYLENEGYCYITAKDGVETLEKTRGEMPDLVLLDVNMPNKDGFTVLEELRADPVIRHIPVIILTAARLDAIEVQFGLNLGADDYITKPFDRRELLARIRSKLRSKEAEDSLRQRLAAVLNIVSDAILIFDSRNHLSLANPVGQGLCTAAGLKPGEPLPAGQGHESLRQLMDQAQLSEAALAGEVEWPDQRVFSASITPVPGDGCVVVLHGVTHIQNPETSTQELIGPAHPDLRHPIASIE